MTISNDLERLHKQIDSAIGPFTLMMGRRKYSPSVLKDVVKGLRDSADAIEKFLNEDI